MPMPLSDLSWWYVSAKSQHGQVVASDSTLEAPGHSQNYAEPQLPLSSYLLLPTDLQLFSWMWCWKLTFLLVFQSGMATWGSFKVSQISTVRKPLRASSVQYVCSRRMGYSYRFLIFSWLLYKCSNNHKNSTSICQTYFQVISKSFSFCFCFFNSCM